MNHRDDYHVTTADIHAFSTDHFDLARWLLNRYTYAPLVLETIAAHGVIALAFNEDSDVHWRKLASFTFTELKTIEAERDLTPSEQRIRSTAERIYDSEVKVAALLGIDLFPEDTDRAAARGQRDEALERALVELAPYIKTGDPK